MTLLYIAEWCARVRQGLRGRYVRALEDEVARGRAEIVRLREENRALLNSVLGTAGVAPIETPPKHPVTAAAVRRRSWPQIATTREIETGRQSWAREREAKGEG